jgi:pimeloyl-ACP methyl ester carboxylesterase
MAEYLAAFESDGHTIAAVSQPPNVPVVVISSGDQPPEQTAAHRRMAERSIAGRHVVARRSGHWIQFDEPELVIDVIRDLMESIRPPGSAPRLPC